MTPPSEPLRAEHGELFPKVEAIRAAAASVGDVAPGQLLPLIDHAVNFLRRELIPHAKAEDAALYPAVNRLLGAPEATYTMSLDHEEVGRLTDSLEELRGKVASGELTHEDADELRLVLYGLYVLVRLHFQKEEEAYLPLLDARLDEAQARELFESMEEAATRIRAALEKSEPLGTR